jgi:hypothetical protein
MAKKILNGEARKSKEAFRSRLTEHEHMAS